VISGYVAHAVLGAFGVAALVAASPILFEFLRWCGVAYLAYLAIQMIRSAMSAGSLSLASRPEEFHLRALLEPCRNLSIHTAPDVRPLP
jgi:threonine/homoserine/homoserine lactone efflux protein